MTSIPRNGSNLSKPVGHSQGPAKPLPRSTAGAQPLSAPLRGPSNVIWYVLSLVFSLIAFVSSGRDWRLVGLISILAASLFATRIANYRNIFHMTWMFGHYTFCVMIVVLFYLGDVELGYEVAAVCSAFTLMALWLTDREIPPPQQSIPGSKLLSRLYILSVGVFFGLLLLSTGSTFHFLWPCLSLLFLVSSAGRSKVVVTVFYVLLLSQLATYFFLFWGGFGRLLIAGSILPPTIFLCYALELKHVKIPLLAGGMVAGLFATLLRFKDAAVQDLTVTALSDSAASPMLTGQAIYEHARVHGMVGLSGSVDQFVLFFLGVFPRAFWPSKPNGFGFQYVLENMDTTFADQNHSIASSFCGEHFYYLGPWIAFFGITAAVGLMTTLYNVLAGRGWLFGFAGYTVTIHVPTFYWGGLASYSQRFLFGIIPVLMFALIYRLAYSRMMRSRE